MVQNQITVSQCHVLPLLFGCRVLHTIVYCESVRLAILGDSLGFLLNPDRTDQKLTEAISDDVSSQDAVGFCRHRPAQGHVIRPSTNHTQRLYSARDYNAVIDNE